MDDKIQKTLSRMQAVLHKAPRAIGGIVSNHFRQNFAKQGFDDNGVRKWPARKRDGAKDKGRAILTKSGRLKRSIRLKKATTEEIIVGTSTPYAKVHNDGGIIHRKAYGRRTGTFHIGTRKEIKKQVKRADYRMPQRKFMGPSENLNKKINQWYTKEIQKAIKQSFK